MKVTPDQLKIHYGTSNYVFRRADGRMVQGAHKTYDEFTFGLVREGRLCILCDHIQSEPMPEQCEFGGNADGVSWRCPMRIRDDQLRVLEANFLGFHDYTPPDPDDMFDREQESWVKKAGVWLPNGIDAAS